MCHRILPIAFSPTDPRCHGNKIWDKSGYNLACIRDFCVYRGVFGDGPLNAANLIFPRPTPVAMATKFGTKLAIIYMAISWI